MELIMVMENSKKVVLHLILGHLLTPEIAKPTKMGY